MEKSIQVGNIVIRRSNVLDKEEKEQISRLAAVCNRADGTCNELFLTNEFNVYPEMPCFFRAYVENGSTELGLAGILIIYGDQEKMAEISAYVLPEQRGKGFFMLFFIRLWSISGFLATVNWNLKQKKRTRLREIS